MWTCFVLPAGECSVVGALGVRLQMVFFVFQQEKIKTWGKNPNYQNWVYLQSDILYVQLLKLTRSAFWIWTQQNKLWQLILGSTWVQQFGFNLNLSFNLECHSVAECHLCQGLFKDKKSPLKASMSPLHCCLCSLPQDTNHCLNKSLPNVNQVWPANHPSSYLHPPSPDWFHPNKVREKESEHGVYKKDRSGGSPLICPAMEGARREERRHRGLHDCRTNS